MAGEKQATPDELNEVIKGITGLDSTPINDRLRSHTSEEHGNIIIELNSFSQLEEDISQMDREKTILGVERETEILYNAFRDILKTIGKYIPENKILRLFPDVDMNSIDAYDFNRAKFKILVLSGDDFDFFDQNYHPAKDIKRTAFTHPTMDSMDVPIANKLMRVDVTPTKVIVTKDIAKDVQTQLEKNGKLPRELSEPELALIELDMRETLIHETLHALDIATDLPTPLFEGITEWYAQQITFDSAENRPKFNPKEALVSYRNNVEFVSILANVMLEGGIDPDTIDRAFIASDKQARDKVTKFLEDRYDKENVDKIMTWDFKSSKKALDFLVALESEHDSEIATFLKAYKN